MTDAGHDTRRELSDVDAVEALKALAHPRRQAILRQLDIDGPATSADLARTLGWNTGATSYHLRELARYGFVEEVSERAHGRQRWWRVVSRDLRFPRRSQQSEHTRAAFEDLNRRALQEDLETFVRLQADAGGGGGWADAFPHSRGTIRVDLQALGAFFEEYIALLNRYQQPPGDATDARVVVTRLFAYPVDGADGPAGAPGTAAESPEGD